MGDLESGKERIPGLVAASAEGLGVDTKNLIFIWDMFEGMILPEHGLQLKNKVCVLKIYLGNGSTSPHLHRVPRSQERPETGGVRIGMQGLDHRYD